MKRVLASIVAVCLLTGAVSAQDAGRITVVGSGQVETLPDMATITFGVRTQAVQAGDALAANSAAISDVIAVLSDAGMAKKDVQTSGLSLSPMWSDRIASESDRPEISGYMVSNQVTVRVRDLSALGDVLGAVVENGANEFYGLQFGVQEPGAFQDQARAEAVADARRKAEIYAKAAGVKLGQLIELTENGGRAGAPIAFREMAMADSAPIAQGEIALGASVTMVFSVAE